MKEININKCENCKENTKRQGKQVKGVFCSDNCEKEYLRGWNNAVR